MVNIKDLIAKVFNKKPDKIDVAKNIPQDIKFSVKIPLNKIFDIFKRKK